MLVERLYKSRLRAWLRERGLTQPLAKALRYFTDRRRREQEAYYQMYRPSTVEVRILQASCVLRADNQQEYMRALSAQSDKILLEELLSHLHQGDQMWDVGANFGLYSMLCAAHLAPLGGRVLAFEPEPWSRKRLNENAELNQFHHVDCLPLALADKEGTMRFQIAPHGAVDGSSHLLSQNENKDVSNVIEVEVTTGDQVWKRNGFSVPAVIKIDVEGYEREVLLGMNEILQQPTCRFVLVEVHFGILEKRGLTRAPDEIEACLRSHGFQKLKWLDPSHLAASKP